MKFLRVLLVCAVLFNVFFFPAKSKAELAVINDIKVNSRGGLIKIEIASNKPLQIESFKNEEDSTNYVVVDFVESVYADLPAVIAADEGAVEKVSLVKSEKEQVQINGKQYYCIDFLAVTLNAPADYKIIQRNKKISLNITPVTPAKKTTLKAKKDIFGSNDSLGTRKSIAVSNKKEKKEIKQKIKRVKDGAAKRGGLGNIFKRQRKTTNPRKTKERVVISSVKNDTESALLNRFMQDAVTEKSQADERIDKLSSDLKKMKEMLASTKGAKIDVENKINAMSSKLDEISDVLNTEVERKQNLDAQINELVAKKKAYVIVKNKFDVLEKKFITAQNDQQSLNIEVSDVKNKLDDARIQKTRIKEDKELIKAECGKLKMAYEENLKIKNATTEKMNQLSKQMTQLKGEMDKLGNEKEKLDMQLKKIGIKSKYRENELLKLERSLEDRSSLCSKLSHSYDELLGRLKSAEAKKSAIEIEYMSVKSEYEKNKSDVNKLLLN